MALNFIDLNFKTQSLFSKISNEISKQSNLIMGKKKVIKKKRYTDGKLAHKKMFENIS